MAAPDKDESTLAKEGSNTEAAIASLQANARWQRVFGVLHGMVS